MAELTVEKTYGKALYDVAAELGKVQPFLEELQAIRELLLREPDFFELIKTPVISGSEKKQIVDQVFSGKISQEILNFLFVLIDKRRTVNFPRIVDQYVYYVEQSKGYTQGVIYSTATLSAEQLSGFEGKVGRLLAKKVALENRLDASLLGGVKIMVEGKIIDASIRKRLEDLTVSIHNA